MENIKMLELFKGTGSQGKAAIELGVLEKNIVSVDMDAKWKPTILGNILELDYTKWEVPDIITASPPCETFSILIPTHRNKVRDYMGDMRPLNEKGEIGDAVLFKTIEIIKYFLDKNPNLKFVIENPRGFMKKMTCMSEEPIKYMCEGWYSCYGYTYRKPTNFWSNTPIKLKKGKQEEDLCGTKDNGVEMLSFKLAQRYSMPPLLCKSIIEQLVMEEIDI
jgi:site-specific DNA-cytosine methylase